jgi:hypothetical protein
VKTEETVTGVAEMTEEAETIVEAGMTGAEERTEAVTIEETTRTIATGIALNVKTLTSHSEQNVIDVESLRDLVHQTSSVTTEAVETTVAEEMTVAEETTEGAVMTAETIVATIQTMIGTVQNVKTQTLHSEQNVIDVENHEAKAVLTEAMIGAVGTIDEAEMTVEVETTDVVETTVVEEIIDAEETTVETIQTMIGNAENVRTPTSHSEQNVTAVVHLKAVEKEHLPKTGKVMTEDQETGEENKLLDRETGIAHNVESPILLREMIVSVVDVPKE